jgi:hypothetical protein
MLHKSTVNIQLFRKLAIKLIIQFAATFKFLNSLEPDQIKVTLFFICK